MRCGPRLKLGSGRGGAIVNPLSREWGGVVDPCQPESNNKKARHLPSLGRNERY